MNNKEKGRLGEDIASKYIISKGGKIIEQNYRTKVGEVDLIVRINGELVFIEVKSRSNVHYGYPSEAVNDKKKRKIINVAKYYILDNELTDVSIRFDVIEIYLRAKKITGKQFDQTLEKIGITVNKNTIPNDPESPSVTSGVRIGLTAVSERGFGHNEIAEVADIMEKVADNIDDEKILEECKKQARDLISRFPLYPQGYFED